MRDRLAAGLGKRLVLPEPADGRVVRWVFTGRCAWEIKRTPAAAQEPVLRSRAAVLRPERGDPAGRKPPPHPTGLLYPREIVGGQ